MTEEELKQKADDFIITRQNHIKYFSGEAVKILLKNFAVEIVAEATKELQEENRQLKNDYEMIHNCFLISENEKKELQSENEELQQKYLSESYEKAKLVEQIEKMKCCGNCKHHYFIGDELECRLLDKGINCDNEEKWELTE